MSKNLVAYWLSKPLTSLKQGSTVSVRSSIKDTNVAIQSKWRDEGHLRVLQKLEGNNNSNNSNSENSSNTNANDLREAHISVSDEGDRPTSLGRSESHVKIELQPSESRLGEKFSSSVRGNGLLRLLHSLEVTEVPKGFETYVLDDGILANKMEDFSRVPPLGFKQFDYKEGISLFVRDDDGLERPSTTVSLEVPEKINIECDLTKGGKITIHNKVEGDVRLVTADGDIVVSKVRGHSVDISTGGHGSSVYASDLLEAQTLTIKIDNGGRFRAKRIHASTCDIDISKAGDDVTISSEGKNKKPQAVYDDDDMGSLCDVSSIYVTGDAKINVQSSSTSRQAVRIKSHHGHIVIDAKAPKPVTTNKITNEILPIVDMSGVNGSCDVTVECRNDVLDGNEELSTDWISCHAHFDSISSDSVTVLTADSGKVHATFDRKVESDIRLLSASNLDSVNVDTLLDYNNNHDNVKTVETNDDFEKMLSKIDATSMPVKEKMIEIQTRAFTEKKRTIDRNSSSSSSSSSLSSSVPKNYEFVDGWIENTSAEPDSRFDRKLRGETGSIGKIRLDGAANQALYGFHQSSSMEEVEEKKNPSSSSSDTSSSSFIRPIVLIVSSSQIVVETLSWLGNIARRYGLQDGRDEGDLGRTATRRGRSFNPTKQ